jgi:hypothetical protein
MFRASTLRAREIFGECHVNSMTPAFVRMLDAKSCQILLYQ